MTDKPQGGEAEKLAEVAKEIAEECRTTGLPRGSETWINGQVRAILPILQKVEQAHAEALAAKDRERDDYKQRMEDCGRKAIEFIVQRDTLRADLAAKETMVQEKAATIIAIGHEIDAVRAQASASEYRRCAAEHRAQRIVLDAELKARADAAEAQVRDLQAENALLRQPLLDVKDRARAFAEGAVNDIAADFGVPEDGLAEALATMAEPYMTAAYHDGMRASLSKPGEKPPAAEPHPVNCARMKDAAVCGYAFGLQYPAVCPCPCHAPAPKGADERS